MREGILFIVGVGLILLVQSEAREAYLPCDAKFSRVNPDHTACLVKSGNGTADEQVSDANKKYIVNLHNYFRANVNKFNQPSAADMQKMYWDEELAMLAQKWASNCIWEHDKSENRNIPGSYPVGQNLGKGHNGWGAVIRHWQSEVKFLSFAQSKEPFQPIGHYTQMVWASSSRVGCGFAKCNQSTSFYVCDYAPTGNFAQKTLEPYKAGEQASSCLNRREGGLCDCGGKICKNGGNLNLATCECDCPRQAWTQGSEDCSLDCDKAVDSLVCSTKGGEFGKDHCSKYVNVPYEFCPVMCNLCPPKAKSQEQQISSILSHLLGSDTNDFSDLNDLNDTDNINGYNFEDILDNTAKKQSTLAPLFPTTEAFSLPQRPAIKSTTLFSTARPTGKPSFIKAILGGIASPLDAVAETKQSELQACAAVEAAKCGQPSARGYYDPKYCEFGLEFHCPAMCGECSATSCQDYEGRSFKIGDVWMNEYGMYTCTTQGVRIQRGCHIEKIARVLDPGEDYAYVDGKISWMCSCSKSYALSCKGIWTRRRH